MKTILALLRGIEACNLPGAGAASRASQASARLRAGLLANNLRRGKEKITRARNERGQPGLFSRRIFA